MDKTLIRVWLSSSGGSGLIRSGKSFGFCRWLGTYAYLYLSVVPYMPYVSASAITLVLLVLVQLALSSPGKHAVDARPFYAKVKVI